MLLERGKERVKKKKRTSERNISLIRKREEERERKRGNAIIRRDSTGEFDSLLGSKELTAGS